MMKHLKILASMMIIFLIIIPVCCFGATETETTESEKQPAKLYPFPVIFSSPETGFALGAMLFYYPNLEVSSLGQKPDVLSAMIYGTEKGQYSGIFGASKYFYEGKQWLLISTSTCNAPGYFYKIGSDTTADQKEKYTLVESVMDASYLWETIEHLYLGPSVLYANASVNDKARGGMLENGGIIGSNGINATGAGFKAIWDETKDFARQGYVITLQANDFLKDLGSDENFTRVVLDGRNYIPLGQEKVFAIQGVLVSNSGSVPFEFMPSIGGVLGRGIEGGRFSDKNCLALQGEYRFPVSGIFGMVIFGGFGEVAPSLSDMNFSDLKTMGGIGFRFTLDKEHNIKLRLDVSGNLEQRNINFNIGEAF